MKVLVTGGAGFLGRGILRQISRGQLDWDVTVFSRDETKQDECRRRYPFARYVLGDVRDTDLLAAAMAGHDAVVHAGAMKYIVEAELNAAECVSVNVGGSRSVMMAARRAGVGNVVGISTDKAVQPVNVYGATKMLMERMFAEASTPGTTFSCVRYGNVVGSTGSVIPLFKRQYAEMGKVLITSPKMSRFWMGVDEAIKLIKCGLSTAAQGSVVVPMARAMTIVDVARAATKDDVEIEVIGERPGEKMSELLIHFEESVRVLQNVDFYELLPVGSSVKDSAGNGRRAFTLSSNAPNHRMSVVEMRELIEDSASV